MSRNDTARELGIGPSTVSRHAVSADISFACKSTKAATAARQVDNAARRAKLAGALLADLDRTRRGIMKAETETPKGYE